MSSLFDSLVRYGDVFSLNDTLDYLKFQEGINIFDDKWVRYNPRKPIERYGLSITSLDGKFSGIPDLDSVREYNKENNLTLGESDFSTLTDFWPHVESVLSRFKNHLGRTHVIKMPAGGHFPSHRDYYDREVNECRLFIPVYNCNPPHNYFILDGKIINFEQGRLYFLNTCKEHIVFTTSNESMFIVANILLTEESVDLILHNMHAT